MTDTTTTTEVPALEPQAPPAVVPVADPVDLVIADLRERVFDFLTAVDLLRDLRDDGFFKYLSKQRRNALLAGLVDDVDTLKDLTKAAVQGLRKIKRERISEETLDALLEARSED